MKIGKKTLSILLSVCMIFSLMGSLSTVPASASGSNSDMISFHVSSTSDWSAFKFLSSWQTFSAGNYKASVKLKKISGDEPYLKIGNEYEINNISQMTNYTSSLDSTNNVYTITFTLTSSWSGNLGWYIGNYGRITSFIVAKPTLYLLDSSGNPTGSNLAVDFCENNYCTGRTGNKWLKAGFYSNLVTVSDYDEDTFSYVSKMLKIGGFQSGAGQQALCCEKILNKNTYYQFDMDYRACGGVSAYRDLQVINNSGKWDVPSDDNWQLVSWTDTGTHMSVQFKVPSNATTSSSNFKLYVGQTWPQKKNGIVYFANFSLFALTGKNGSVTGSNVFSNGDFHDGTTGIVTSDNKDIVFSDFEQIKIMNYPQVELMAIPQNFFTDDKNLSLDKAYKFKGGDLYKPQFDFQFQPSTTYQLKYDYYCADNDTVNAYILSKDNSVTAQKVSKTGNGKFEATYTITTSSTTNEYTDYYWPNTNIRFALNGNSYDNPFYITNIRLYKTSGGQPTGANLAYNLNPVLDDATYGLTNTVSSVDFSLNKDDESYTSIVNNVSCSWLGELNYDGTNTDAYSKIEKINATKFNYYTVAQRLTHLVNAILEKQGAYNPYTDSNSKFYDPNGDKTTNILDLVKLKIDAANNVDRFAVSNEQTNGGIYSSFNSITCWGDSLTQGMNMSTGNSYPERLNSYIGNGYTVYNSGDPGEKSQTIMARQGALSLKTSKAFTFANGVSKITIGDQDDNGFITSNGYYLGLTSTLGNQKSVNNVNIGGKLYKISLKDFVWSPRSYTVELERLDTTGSITVPVGTSVTLNNTTNQNECEIYYIGANGDYNNDRYNLIAQYKAMIDNHGSNNYIVIIPHFYYCHQELKAAFGDHCVDFVKVACSDEGFTYEGLTKTSTDETWMADYRVPPSFRLYPNDPDVHLNKYGYDLIAHLIYEKGKEIGYFN